MKVKVRGGLLICCLGDYLSNVHSVGKQAAGIYDKVVPILGTMSEFYDSTCPQIHFYNVEIVVLLK